MTQAKRVEIVSLNMIRNRSVLYRTRYIKSPNDVVELVNEHLQLDQADRECFLIIAVDTKSQPTHIHTVSTGSLTASIVHPREVFKAAILASSHSILAVHNHPSGDPQPSKEDMQITTRLKEAGQLLGIPLVDHIIVGEMNQYYSFKEEGNI